MKRPSGKLWFAGLAMAALHFGLGCSSAPDVALPSPATGEFLSLEQQRRLSSQQVDAYCRMLDDYRAELRADVELAQSLTDSLSTVLDSLNDAHGQANRDARMLERELRLLQQERREQTTYITREGDTLMKLSGLFYGTAADWRKIYEANRDKIEDPGQELEAGLKLTIP
jgi:nucleoid-associated protein YgaU